MNLARIVVLSAIAFAAFGAQARAMPSAVYDGRIAFISQFGLVSMNGDGSGQWAIADRSEYGYPAWSPDGSLLAASVHGLGREGIVVMQPDGSQQQLLVSGDGEAESPAWSPDGSRLAYADGADLVTVAADGGDSKIVYSSPTPNIQRPSWSPDGSRIAFAESDPVTGEWHISILDLASGKATALPEQNVFDPAWSPDGKRIAFADGDYLQTMAPDGTDVQFVAQDGREPAWSPDGREIAFQREGSQIWVVKPDGSDPHELATGDGAGSPTWQPLPPGPDGCTIWGTPGNDVLVGTDANDVVCGLAGNDRLIGGGGNDILDGGAGNDYLAGGPGTDIFNGGPGNDVLDARDGQHDLVDGGSGRDTAIVDGRIDETINVEHVVVDHDLAAWRPAIASSSEPGWPASNAFDGDPATSWNGGYASLPAWVQVDLGERERVGSVRLDTVATLGGPELLLGSATAAGPFRLLHAFAGPMADNEQIRFAPRAPWRNIRYLRVAVAVGDVATGAARVPELAVYAPKAT